VKTRASAISSCPRPANWPRSAALAPTGRSGIQRVKRVFKGKQAGVRPIGRQVADFEEPLLTRLAHVARSTVHCIASAAGEKRGRRSDAQVGRMSTPTEMHLAHEAKGRMVIHAEKTTVSEMLCSFADSFLPIVPITLRTHADPG
jgi:hypothetical protein